MLVTVRGLPKQVKLTSIILESDVDDPKSLRMFWCPNCGDSLFQYSGQIVMVVPGGMPTLIPIIIECKRCKNKYLVNSIV